MYTFDEIEKTDSEIADAIKAEMERLNLLPQKTLFRLLLWLLWEACLPINMPKAIQVKDIMAAASV